MTHSQVYCTDKLRKNLFFTKRGASALAGVIVTALSKPRSGVAPLLLRGRLPRRHGVLRALHRLRRRDPPPRHGLIILPERNNTNLPRNNSFGAFAQPKLACKYTVCDIPPSHIMPTKLNCTDSENPVIRRGLFFRFGTVRLRSETRDIHSSASTDEASSASSCARLSAGTLT